MTDSKLILFAIAVAVVGAWLAGTTLRDGTRNHSGIEPRDTFGLRERGYARRDCVGSIWSDRLDCGWQAGRR